jgi:hypothetical protein
MCIPEAKLVTAGANITAQNEPWLLGKHVTQCFIITDPTKPSRVVVRRGKRNIIGMDGVANEEDFDQYDDPMEDDDKDNTTYTTYTINGKSTFCGTEQKSASVAFLAITRATRMSGMASFRQTVPWSRANLSYFDLKVMQPRMW